MRKLKRLPTTVKVLRLHRNSGVFDFEWYLRTNPDVRLASGRPFLHFAFHGIFEGRPPNAHFDSVAYLTANPDIVRSGLTPLEHYMLEGCYQNRRLAPSPVKPEVGSNRGNKTPEKDMQELAAMRTERRRLIAENKELLAQLHGVQEQLEGFLLKSPQRDSERRALQERLGDLTREKGEMNAQKKALEGRIAEWEHDLGAVIKERDALRTERDDLISECAQLKKNLREQVTRIAGMDAQIARQEEKQKLIDEQLLRAETQIGLLKEFMQPAFQDRSRQGWLPE